MASCCRYCVFARGGYASGTARFIRRLGIYSRHRFNTVRLKINLLVKYWANSAVGSAYCFPNYPITFNHPCLNKMAAWNQTTSKDCGHRYLIEFFKNRVTQVTLGRKDLIVFSTRTINNLGAYCAAFPKVCFDFTKPICPPCQSHVGQGVDVIFNVTEILIK